jgi:hypothetical protein
MYILFLAYYFDFDIKASLVTDNPLIRTFSKYSKTGTSISGFLSSLGPEEDFLFQT